MTHELLFYCVIIDVDELVWFWIILIEEKNSIDERHVQFYLLAKHDPK